jgi:deazaflavin-dependent oxidoreductase (nitroreductase family)
MAPRKAFRIHNRVLNPMVRPILGSPLHALLDRSLMLLTVTGRRSGVERTFPVQYAQSGDDLFVYVGASPDKRWWRNVVGGVPAQVVVRGKRLEATAETIERSADRARALGTWLTRYPSVARRLRVSRAGKEWDAYELARAAEDIVMVRVHEVAGGSPSQRPDA